MSKLITSSYNVTNITKRDDVYTFITREISSVPSGSTGANYFMLKSFPGLIEDRGTLMTTEKTLYSTQAAFPVELCVIGNPVITENLIILMFRSRDVKLTLILNLDYCEDYDYRSFRSYVLGKRNRYAMALRGSTATVPIAQPVLNSLGLHLRSGPLC